MPFFRTASLLRPLTRLGGGLCIVALLGVLLGMAAWRPATPPAAPMLAAPALHQLQEVPAPAPDAPHGLHMLQTSEGEPTASRSTRVVLYGLLQPQPPLAWLRTTQWPVAPACTLPSQQPHLRLPPGHAPPLPA